MNLLTTIGDAIWRQLEPKLDELMEFKMDPNFEREKKRELQRKLTRVYNGYRGQPVSEVTAALEREGV